MKNMPNNPNILQTEGSDEEKWHKIPMHGVEEDPPIITQSNTADHEALFIGIEPPKKQPAKLRKSKIQKTFKPDESDLEITEEPARKEAEEIFKKEAKGFEPALKEAGLLEQKPKEEKKKKTKEEGKERIKMAQKEAESAYTPSKNELYLENKITEINDITDQDRGIEEKFQLIFNRFEKMNYTNFFSWERMKYIMMGYQDQDKEELFDLINSLDKNYSKVKIIDRGIDSLMKDDENIMEGRAGTLLNEAKIMARNYLEDRQARKDDLLNKMKQITTINSER